MPNSLPRTVYTVSNFSNEVKTLLESSFPDIWIEGEISNLATPASGHAYFSLKDAHAQVRCAFFRNRRLRSPIALANGMAVVVHADVSLYVQRGDFQLIVTHLEDAGEGELRRRYEALKRRLDHEGLFDPAHKRKIPKYPSAIALVTSETGAAIRDMLTTIGNHYPIASVRLYPALVQGPDAPASIVTALESMEQDNFCDVAIVGRGGGTLEDLWAFNDESVVRAIGNCQIPIITGIGHQTDLTLADLVADRYGATPTAAAEAATPDSDETLQFLASCRARIQLAMRRRTERAAQEVDALNARLRHPAAIVQQQVQRHESLHARIQNIAHTRTQRDQILLLNLSHRLHARSPAITTDRAQTEWLALKRQLFYLGQQLLTRPRQHLEAASARLNTLSPHETVKRGYAIVRLPGSGAVVTEPEQLRGGDTVHTEVSGGWFDAQVERAGSGQRRSLLKE